MKLRIGVLSLVLASLFCVTSRADTLWDYQIVNEIGYGIHPLVWADENDPASRVTVEGVALAGYDEILNPNFQYTVFLQDDQNPKGGLQAWTGKFFYGDELWAILRQTSYIDFEAGDRLRITGLLADMGRGKVVINNRGHQGSPNLIWHVEIIGHVGLPDPELIPSVSHCNYFDHTRAGGGELYQTRYVMLHGVEASGTWGNNKLMTITDATGSVGMLLSAMGDFNSYPQPAGRLNVVGIFDQEDDQQPPYTDGYRVWVKRYSDIAMALNACRQAKGFDSGARVALVNKIVSRVYDGFFYIQDESRAGGIRIIGDRQFSPGDVVAVQGLVSELGDEKALNANYLTKIAGGIAPEPLTVNSKALWGESGLDVHGLLVKIFAKIGTYQGDGLWSLIDDGGNEIRLDANGHTVPSLGAKVMVTAVATKENGIPLLLLASGDDIQEIN